MADAAGGARVFQLASAPHPSLGTVLKQHQSSRWISYSTTLIIDHIRYVPVCRDCSSSRQHGASLCGLALP